MMTTQTYSQRTHHLACGFSLVELIVTMELFILSALIAVPKLNGFHAEYQLLSASNQIAFDIVRARMQAVGQNRYVRLRMISGTQYVREISADKGVTWGGAVTTTLPRRVTALTTTARVQFDNRGIATLANPVTLDNALRQRKTVVTNTVGRVTIS